MSLTIVKVACLSVWTTFYFHNIIYMVIITLRHKGSFSPMSYFANLIIQYMEHVTTSFEKTHFLQNV